MPLRDYFVHLMVCTELYLVAWAVEEVDSGEDCPDKQSWMHLVVL